jgi:hypothetical protein
MWSDYMKNKLIPNGEYVTINNHKIHIYKNGNKNKPKLVFMSGSGTVAPVYDFKMLYEKLIEDYRIIVIEKFGYGYSDITDYPCDIDSLVELQRQVLELSNESEPYILVSHSASGLEAIRWEQKYPNEIKAIIGIDMTNPFTYKNWSSEQIVQRIKLMKNRQKFGIYKLLSCKINRSLTKEEIFQQKLLRKRNAFNMCYINEAKEVLNNSSIVENGKCIECPILLFVSNGKQTSKNWIKIQNEFANKVNAKIVNYDCGHYMHHYKSNEICNEIKQFTNKLK